MSGNVPAGAVLSLGGIWLGAQIFGGGLLGILLDNRPDTPTDTPTSDPGTGSSGNVETVPVVPTGTPPGAATPATPVTPPSPAPAIPVGRPPVQTFKLPTRIGAR